jgi:hypothetical protein
VVDLEDEYGRWAEAAGGTYVPLSAPGVGVNPFDLGPAPGALTPSSVLTPTSVPGPPIGQLHAEPGGRVAHPSPRFPRGRWPPAGHEDMGLPRSDGYGAGRLTSLGGSGDGVLRLLGARPVALMDLRGGDKWRSPPRAGR